MNFYASIFWYFTTVIGTTEPQFELSYPGTRFRVSEKNLNFYGCFDNRFQAFRAEPKRLKVQPAQFLPDQFSFDWPWNTKSSVSSNNILQDISWLKRCEITRFQNYFAVCQYK